MAADPTAEDISQLTHSYMTPWLASDDEDGATLLIQCVWRIAGLVNTRAVEAARAHPE
jgi:hypothetical protein